MLLNEIAKETGMTKRAVKYYEEKGLLSVHKDGNGYRNYSPQDVETLKKISVYRKLGISMDKLGMMTEYGRAVLPDMTPAGFVIDDDILAALQTDDVVWSNFQSFPELYQRVRIDTIQIKKKQPKLFLARLQKLIDNTRNGVMYGEWNDNGRLLNY